MRWGDIAYDELAGRSPGFRELAENGQVSLAARPAPFRKPWQRLTKVKTDLQEVKTVYRG